MQVQMQNLNAGKSKLQSYKCQLDRQKGCQKKILVDDLDSTNGKKEVLQLSVSPKKQLQSKRKQSHGEQIMQRSALAATEAQTNLSNIPCDLVYIRKNMQTWGQAQLNEQKYKVQVIQNQQIAVGQKAKPLAENNFTLRPETNKHTTLTKQQIVLENQHQVQKYTANADKQSTLIPVAIVLQNTVATSSRPPTYQIQSRTSIGIRAVELQAQAQQTLKEMDEAQNMFNLQQLDQIHSSKIPKSKAMNEYMLNINSSVDQNTIQQKKYTITNVYYDNQIDENAIYGLKQSRTVDGRQGKNFHQQTKLSQGCKENQTIVRNISVNLGLQQKPEQRDKAFQQCPEIISITGQSKTNNGMWTTENVNGSIYRRDSQRLNNESLKDNFAINNQAILKNNFNQFGTKNSAVFGDLVTAIKETEAFDKSEIRGSDNSEGSYECKQRPKSSYPPFKSKKKNILQANKISESKIVRTEGKQSIQKQGHSNVQQASQKFGELVITGAGQAKQNENRPITQNSFFGKRKLKNKGKSQITSNEQIYLVQQPIAGQSNAKLTKAHTKNQQTQQRGSIKNQVFGTFKTNAGQSGNHTPLNLPNASSQKGLITYDHIHQQSPGNRPTTCKLATHKITASLAIDNKNIGLSVEMKKYQNQDSETVIHNKLQDLSPSPIPFKMNQCQGLTLSLYRGKEKGLAVSGSSQFIEQTNQMDIEREQKQKLNTAQQNKQKNGTVLQLLPSTPKIFKRTKRIIFQRRMSYMDRPLIVICFQGVLGDFFKPIFKQPIVKEIVPKHKFEKAKVEEKQEALQIAEQWQNLNLRTGALEGLRYLSHHYQLVIFSRESLEDSWGLDGGQIPPFGEQTKVLKQLLIANSEIKIDAFYCSTLPPKKTGLCDDYSQIFIDFGLNSEKKIRERVLFVQSINNDYVPGLIPNMQQVSDLDSKGYFMFDFSCQPVNPLVSGIPIAVEQNQTEEKKQKVKKERSKLQEDEEEGTELKDGIQLHEMPVTVLVPNARCQVPRTQLAFNQIVKSIMVLAILGQKKMIVKQMKTNAPFLFLGDQVYIGDLAELSALKTLFEMEIGLKRNRITINKKAQEETLNFHQQQKDNLNIRSQRVQLLPKPSPRQDRIDQDKTRNLNVIGGSSQTKIANVLPKQNISLQSSRTSIYAIKNGNTFAPNQSSTFQQESQSLHRQNSIVSEKQTPMKPLGETQTNSGEDKESCQLTEKDENEEMLQVTFELNENFFSNLDWSHSSDFLNERPITEHRKILGLRTAQSDVAWRFFKKQELEKIQLRQLYEKRMQAIQVLVDKLFTETSIIQSYQKNSDEIFEILRSKDNVVNPLTSMMCRNHRIFANLKYGARNQLQKQLQAYKALSEQANELTSVPKTAKAGSKQELNQTQKNQSLYEEFLEKNTLVNRIIMVGMDMPHQFYRTIQHNMNPPLCKIRVLEKHNPSQYSSARPDQSNYFTNEKSRFDQKQKRQIETASQKENSLILQKDSERVQSSLLQVQTMQLGQFQSNTTATTSTTRSSLKKQQKRDIVTPFCDNDNSLQKQPRIAGLIVAMGNGDFSGGNPSQVISAGDEQLKVKLIKENKIGQFQNHLGLVQTIGGKNFELNGKKKAMQTSHRSQTECGVAGCQGCKVCSQNGSCSTAFTRGVETNES